MYQFFGGNKNYWSNNWFYEKKYQCGKRVKIACRAVLLQSINLISREKIVKSSYGTDFKVYFTKNSWNCFTQFALNLISQKISWNRVADLISKLISRKILETELCNNAICYFSARIVKSTLVTENITMLGLSLS